MKQIVLLFLGFAMTVPAMAKRWLVADLPAFDKALQEVQAGDTIVWKNGRYTDLPIWFKPAKNGAAGKRIVLMAEMPGQVIFSGKSRLAIDGQWLEANGFVFQGPSGLEKEDVIAFSALGKNTHQSTDCLLRNCGVINYNPADAETNNNWVAIQGQRNEVSHCHFEGKINQGPTLVVRYHLPKEAPEASSSAAPGQHHIHHNYFGQRTMPGDNGGEHMRIGDSRTSFTSGQNLIEYNWFQEHKEEPEVISNKSWHNVYRYNLFLHCEGALVLRHGQECLAYGNFFDGSITDGKSGGIRIINANQSVFANTLTNLEGGGRNYKFPITIMGGLQGSAINEYYPADSALVAGNLLQNVAGPSLGIGIVNRSKGKSGVAPRQLMLAGNRIVQGKLLGPVKLLMEEADVDYALVSDNQFFGAMDPNKNGFTEGKKLPLDAPQIPLPLRTLLISRAAKASHVLPVNAFELIHRQQLPQRQQVGVTYPISSIDND